MKLFKVFGILAVLMMTVSLTSCLKSDDSDDLEKKWEDWLKQVDTEIKASAGSYEGKLYSLSNESTDTETKLDSIAAVWKFNNDSTIDLLNVPAELLVKKIPESQKTLQEAVANAGNVNIHVKLAYNYYYCSPLVMYVYPEYVTFPVNYENATHQIKITFWNSDRATGTFAKYMTRAISTGVSWNYILSHCIWMTSFKHSSLPMHTSSGSVLRSESIILHRAAVE